MKEKKKKAEPVKKAAPEFVTLSERDLKKGKVCKFDNRESVSKDRDIIEITVKFNKENLETYTVEKNGNTIHISKTLFFIEQRVQGLVDKYNLKESK
jgi:hypothetical protein